MKMAVLFFVLFPFSALAHVEPGTWTGKTSSGSDCAMVAGATYFEGVAHPLNERIVVRVAGKEFKVGHPPVLDFTQAKAFFNHDVFQGVLATPGGADAIEIAMSHESGREGPVSFTLVQHSWKKDERTSFTCASLVHKAE